VSCPECNTEQITLLGLKPRLLDLKYIYLRPLTIDFKKIIWNDISFTVFEGQSLQLVFLNNSCICMYSVYLVCSG